MSEKSIRNGLRIRAILASRKYKEVFYDENGQIGRAQEGVLADLREFCFANKSAFHTDALTMARREGRREVALRIFQFLNLDEATVQAFMEIDDGE